MPLASPSNVQSNVAADASAARVMAHTLAAAPGRWLSLAEAV